jgi:hypothetical protein
MKKSNQVVIDTIYRCRLDFDYTEEYNSVDRPLWTMWSEPTPLEKVERFAHKLSSDSLSVCSTGAGPCWNAYLIFESMDKPEVDKASTSVLRYIKRFKSLRILE